MKRIILAILLPFFFCEMNAQDVFSKKRIDGDVIIMTKPLKVSLPWQPTIEYRLFCRTDNQMINHYSLILSVESGNGNLVFEKGSRLLIQTESGTTIHLINNRGEGGIPFYDTSGIGSWISRRVLKANTMNVYSIEYTADENDIERLTKEGISSLRIETSADNINCNYNHTKSQLIQDYLISSCQNIYDSLNPEASF